MEVKKVLGIVLAVIGSIIVLNFFGIHLGNLVGLLFGCILVGLGFVGWNNNKKWLGGIIVVIGGFIILGNITGIIKLAIVIALIVFGISLFKKRSNRGY